MWEELGTEDCSSRKSSRFAAWRAKHGLPRSWPLWRWLWRTMRGPLCPVPRLRLVFPAPPRPLPLVAPALLARDFLPLSVTPFLSICPLPVHSQFSRVLGFRGYGDQRSERGSGGELRDWRARCVREELESRGDLRMRMAE